MKALAMQLVLFHVHNVNRLKGSQADVQGNLSDFNPTLADGRQDFRCKVQSRGGRSDAASLFRTRIDSLIPLTVFRPVWARDVRWQWHVPQLIDSAEKVWHRIKAKRALAKVASSCN